MWDLRNVARQKSGRISKVGMTARFTVSADMCFTDIGKAMCALHKVALNIPNELSVVNSPFAAQSLSEKRTMVLRARLINCGRIHCQLKLEAFRRRK